MDIDDYECSEGIAVEVMDSHAAVRRFNELIGLGHVDAAAALHLTC